MGQNQMQKVVNPWVKAKEIADVKKDSNKRVKSVIEDPYDDFNMDFDEPDFQEKPNGTKRQMLMEMPPKEPLAMLKLEKPRSVTKNRFGLDESVLRKAEEESELLDSLWEMSERQLHTQKEDGGRDQNGGLLGRLLEDDFAISNYGLGSF